MMPIPSFRGTISTTIDIRVLNFAQFIFVGSCFEVCLDLNQMAMSTKL